MQQNKAKKIKVKRNTLMEDMKSEWNIGAAKQQAKLDSECMLSITKMDKIQGLCSKKIDALNVSFWKKCASGLTSFDHIRKIK